MRTALSALGIAAATGILVVGQFFSDAMGFLVDFYMQKAQRESLAVQLRSARARSVGLRTARHSRRARRAVAARSLRARALGPPRSQRGV